jgi:ATP-dependent DNA helicase RecG
MVGRPEILFPLFGAITTLAGIGPKIAQNLVKLNIDTPRDLLLTLPQSVIVRKPVKSIQGIPIPSVVTVEVTIGDHYPNARKDRPYRIDVNDDTTNFQLVFFHPRKEWLRDNFPFGQRRIISGKLEMFDHMAQMTHPDYVCRVDELHIIPEFEPVYPLTAGVTQKNLAKASNQLLSALPKVEEWIDPSVLAKFSWPDWPSAIQTGHRPNGPEDVSPHSLARQRLAYDEILSHQLTLAIARHLSRKSKGISSKGTGVLIEKVLNTLPFEPTNAQVRAFEEIGVDMAAPIRMNRLLQGDVGAGKTLVAIMAMIKAVESGGQAVMMAPTEILAQQHVASLRPLAEQAGIVLEGLTGRDKGSEREAKIAALARGDIHILVGTHAVFQKTVTFKDLRLAVIDEQHRFGVRQRMDLGAKGAAVDVLVMTATPIPRSLALANYGDMDISVLDEKPKGRKPIETAMVSNTRMGQVVERLRNAITEGRQAYWVCPLVEESDVLDLAAAEDRAAALSLALGTDVVGLVHGRMSAVDKDKVMQDFSSGKIQVLVATTVIEVGVDVPNASIMVIEHAERFGLSQLHQLRGRVGRGTDASICLLLYAPPLGKTAQSRLEALRETNDGFRSAEIDLKLRGAGDVLGIAQSGLPRFRIADLEAQSDLMKLANDNARLIMNKDPNLTSPRGNALRTLLYLMGADQYIHLLSIG